ncbi:MAG: hypothetical protein IT430_13840 [Phycisphaerales bacterium]|nr:hypothetical protein [Phycisphaerales bacterium]
MIERDDTLMDAFTDATLGADDQVPSLVLLRVLLNREKKINRKALCALWDVKPATLGHMLAGRVHITVERWALLFAETRDERILRLLIDPERFAVYALPELTELGNPVSIGAAFVGLDQAHRRMSMYVQRMLGILGDMRVDGDDGELVCDLKHDLPDLIAALLAGSRQVLYLYEQWCERQSRRVAGRIEPNPHDNKAVKR